MGYQTVYQGGNAEIVEKKSRFIAKVIPIGTEEEAAAALEEIKKQYWDARHHCFAYVIGEEQVQERFSDDGEPSGTAGKPILEVIRGEKLRGVMIVVIRYFGGTLLGTGGLVRAYTQAAKEGILASTVITRINGCRLKLVTDYTGLGKIQYLFGQNGIPIADSRYMDKVELEVLVSETEEEWLVKAVTEATNAKAQMERIEACHFAEIEGERKVLD